MRQRARTDLWEPRVSNRPGPPGPWLLSGASGAERNELQTHCVVPPREGNEGRRDGRQEVVAP